MRISDWSSDVCSSDLFIALAALEGGAVIGGLAAYELPKFEQARSEIYIYDLAVDSDHRRKGLAPERLDGLRAIARERGAYVIYVQARTDARRAGRECVRQLRTRGSPSH